MPQTSDLPELPERPVLHRSTFREPAPRPEPVSADALGGTEAPERAEAPASAEAPERAESPRDRRPRHRAERARNRRPSGIAFRRTVALGSVAAMMGVSAFGAIAGAANGDRSTATAESRTGTPIAAAAGAGDTITPVVAPDRPPTVTSDLSVDAAPFTGGTQITVTGEQLHAVASVTVGGTPAPIVAAEDGQVTFAVPAVADTALGEVPVQFADTAGAPVDIQTPTGAITAGASPVQPLETQLTGTREPYARTTPVAIPRTLSLTYTTDPGIDAQVGYVLTYWSGYNSAAYPVIPGNDCANFASQSLVARGWAMDGGWFFDGATGAKSPSWASSTALRDYLASRPDRATPLDDSQRALVKVGDIAQFDWNNSGDRDHTAVVTRVEHSDAGTKVWVGGHTKDIDYWDVDTALATGGGSVSYFSLR